MSTETEAELLTKEFADLIFEHGLRAPDSTVAVIDFKEVISRRLPLPVQTEGAVIERVARAIFAEEQCDRTQKATPQALEENWNARLDERDQAEYRALARAALAAAAVVPVQTPPELEIEREAFIEWLRELGVARRAAAMSVDALIAAASQTPSREAIAEAIDPEAWTTGALDPRWKHETEQRREIARRAADRVLALLASTGEPEKGSE